MNPQNIVVALIVLSAAIYLLRRASKYVLPGGKHGCATGCGSCPSNKTPADSPAGLIQLGQRKAP